MVREEERKRGNRGGKKQRSGEGQDEKRSRKERKDVKKE